jgi:UDP-N-acetylglucosamine diphosphorylase/glucosamine-1-phosphate N-acetyltransferase
MMYALFSFPFGTEKMTYEQTAVVILAAGKGTRMKSDQAKVLHLLGGRPMISYVVETAAKLAGSNVVVVVGTQADMVKREVLRSASVSFALQASQNGTGHAVQCALPELDERIESVVILCGDVPLISLTTLQNLVRMHQDNAQTITLLGLDLDEPYGYGRVVVDDHRRVKRIVEEADASDEERSVRTVNSGVYCVRRSFLDHAIPRLEAANAQSEIYLTDIVEIAVDSSLAVGLMIADEPTELLGINTPQDLAKVEAVLGGARKNA